MSATLFEDLIQNIPATFYRCHYDKDWTAHFINEAILGLAGYPATDFIGNQVRVFKSIVHPDDIDFVDETIDSAIQKNEIWSFEYRIVTRDNEIKWIAETGIALLSEGGEVEYLDGFIIDRSKRKQLEHELAKAHKLEAVGQLAAGIAHEINTPIQFVGDNFHFLGDAFKELCELATLSSQLVDQFKAGEDPVQLLGRLQKTVEKTELQYLLEDIPASINESSAGVAQISEIVKAMKAFSHPGKENKESVDLKRIIQSTLTVARNEWKYVANVETEFEEDLPMVDCFPGEINQVLLNIVVNAAHAIESKKVTEKSSDMGLIKVRAFTEGGLVVVAISDSGCGIDEQHVDKVFDPFFTTKEVGKGTGQGLSMAYTTIVDKHKGKLAIESVLGEGTTMSIKLP